MRWKFSAYRPISQPRRLQEGMAAAVEETTRMARL